jgi:hypothetical protein
VKTPRRLLVLLAIAIVPLQAQATTVMRVPLDEFVKGCDLIVHALVMKSEVKETTGDNPSIWTEVRFQVLDVLKGHFTAPELVIRLPGGAGKNFVISVPGVPRFTPGDEVVLFLEETSDGFKPAGLGLGVYRVFYDENSRKIRAKRSLQGMMIIERDKTGVMYQHSEPITHADDEMDLDVLINEVRKFSTGGAK